MSKKMFFYCLFGVFSVYVKILFAFTHDGDINFWLNNPSALIWLAQNMEEISPTRVEPPVPLLGATSFLAVVSIFKVMDVEYDPHKAEDVFKKLLNECEITEENKPFFRGLIELMRSYCLIKDRHEGDLDEAAIQVLAHWPTSETMSPDDVKQLFHDLSAQGRAFPFFQILASKGILGKNHPDAPETDEKAENYVKTAFGGIPQAEKRFWRGNFLRRKDGNSIVSPGMDLGATILDIIKFLNRHPIGQIVAKEIPIKPLFIKNMIFPPSMTEENPEQTIEKSVQEELKVLKETIPERLKGNSWLLFEAFRQGSFQFVFTDEFQKTFVRSDSDRENIQKVEKILQMNWLAIGLLFSGCVTVLEFVTKLQWKKHMRRTKLMNDLKQQPWLEDYLQFKGNIDSNDSQLLEMLQQDIFVLREQGLITIKN